MGSAGKLEVEVEVKSAAEKMWESIKDSANVFPKALPHQYKSIQVVEGDGKTAGSVQLVHYAEASPLIAVSKEKFDAVDEEKKTISYAVIDGDLLKYYKTFKATVGVVGKGDGSVVKWSCQFEKASGEVPDPNLIRDFAAKNFLDLDVYLQA